ncbi:MAG: VanZ family protein [Bacteroidales bacterium]|nr:VanZ family protein [Bacteroidales bacterium]
MASKFLANPGLKYFWAAGFFSWATLILVLSVLPTNEMIKKSNEDSTFRWDYLEHFGVFVVFALLFGFWRSSTTGEMNRELLYFLIMGSIYASFTEVVQLWIDGRTFNPLDLLFNLLGLLIGIVITRIYILK